MRLCIGACLLLGLGWGGWKLYEMQRGLSRARELVGQRRYEDARRQVAGYLRLHPSDAEAHLLMAEAWIKDDASDESPRRRAETAAALLQQIPAEDPRAAFARLQEARARLLILHQAGRAERLLRESLRLDPDGYQANFLMWKLLDATGRHPQSGPFFWRVYESSRAAERPARLRDWYLSEFFPQTSNVVLDEALGVGSRPNISPTLDRLLLFRNAEPDVPANHAAVARYLVQTHSPQLALETLGKVPDQAAAMNDADYVAVLFETLLELGEFDKAKACFSRWPEPHAGYTYARCEAMLKDRVLKDYSGAAVSYRRALSFRPGHFDWLTMTSLAHCLTKLGRHREAAKLRDRVQEMTERIMTNERMQSFKEKLANLNDPAILRQLSGLYADLGLDRESQAWDECRERLVSSFPSSSRSVDEDGEQRTGRRKTPPSHKPLKSP